VCSNADYRDLSGASLRVVVGTETPARGRAAVPGAPTATCVALLNGGGARVHPTSPDVTAKVLLRGGCVLTLGKKTPNFAQADVFIEDGRIAEIGPAVRARDAEEIDASETIVMPGFVDTHRHTWRSVFRNLGDSSTNGEALNPRTLGRHFQPDDVYAATLVGLLGAAEAGITTVVDWSDLPVDDALAAAALQAHADAGVRTVFALGLGDVSDAGPRARDVITRLREDAGPRTTIALGLELTSGGVGSDGDPFAIARELGVRIHLHGGSSVPGSNAIARLAEQGFLASDVTLVHAFGLDDVAATALASSGASVSMTPSSEMAGGLRAPPIQLLIDHDVRPALGVDDERVAPGDLFAPMRETISLQHAVVFDRKLAGKAGLPRLMSTRDVIRFATIDGAAAAGLQAITGSLEPGKQADVIVLRTDRPNIYPINDAIGAVVWGMDTSNVGWVFAAGRALMRDGVLEADVERARALAIAARERVAAAAGLVVYAGARGGR
jgi:5-methylthioadenosine/S-adenosylhomocysteine deaminase